MSQKLLCAYIFNIGLACVRMSSTTQTTHVFIPGKNWRLSLAELVSFLEAREVKFEIRSFSKEFFAVSIEESASALAIADLGGILKIGGAATDFQHRWWKKHFFRETSRVKGKSKEKLCQTA